MEYDQQDQEQDGGFWNRLKESPRTVSVLIVILIVAAAIYAFSDDPTENGENVAATPDEETTEMTEGGTEEAEEAEGEESAVAGEEVKAPEAVSSETLNEQNDALPEVEVSEEGYVETAQAGDGITHLARRAATRYLAENEAGYAITNEHRIYIEDYIKDSIGKRGLALDEKVTVPTSLIQEAVEAAGNLTPQQLQNLSKYTSALQ